MEVKRLNKKTWADGVIKPLGAPPTPAAIDGCGGSCCSCFDYTCDHW
ncbi:MAG: hypothetical protein HXS41_08625 [Theionarchaea archaeon]|nr:hypothetical protein [Theionarchaea archaeon]MBU7000949.1 hypothetical protein [Theionarchaea archaeon]MBU7021110.1 hypothetical protein [Theionarchaea archaeon]MBU7033836.1 hypothetical protein [Theionarchaea archaeon]MBU7039896.1 hypothetical protein [Theionarchaea archaeon]